MKAKRSSARNVTKADMLRCIRHLTKAMRQLTDSFHLLRLQIQSDAAKAKKADER